MNDVEEAGEIVVGIDLGTTNSCVAYGPPGQNMVVVPLGQSDTLESIVYVGEGADQEKVFVGKQADLQLLVKGRPERLILRPKSSLGNSSFDRKRFRQDHAHLARGPLDPEDVASFILGHLKYAAEEHVQRSRGARTAAVRPITHAVLGMPAGAGNGFRVALKRSAELAGFHQTYLVPEPVAGAKDFLDVSGASLRPRELLLAVDVGAGTTDVTLIECTTEGKLNVRLCDGDMSLGGNRIDWDLLMFAERKSRGSTLPPTRHNLKTIREFKERVNEIENSADAEAFQEVVFLKNISGENTQVTLQGSEVLAACRTVTDRIRRLVDVFLSEDEALSGRADPIVHVLLLGGAARMRPVQGLVEQLVTSQSRARFSRSSLLGAGQVGSWDPRAAVARGLARLGAAWAAGRMNDTDFIYLPRVARDVGLAVADDKKTPPECQNKVFFHSVHLKKHHIGAGASSARLYGLPERAYKTMHTALRFRFLMGGHIYVPDDAPDAVKARFFNECECLGDTFFELKPPRLGKYVQVSVSYSIDHDGVITVHARDCGFQDLENPNNVRPPDQTDKSIDLRFKALTDDECAAKKERYARLKITGPI